MQIIHTEDRLIEVVIKNWLCGSADLDVGRKQLYHRILLRVTMMTTALWREQLCQRTLGASIGKAAVKRLG